MFIGTFENKIDRKGRVSVPYSFRQVLNTQTFNGIVAFASYREDAIEACGYDFLERINESMETLDLFSKEHDDLATSILGNSHTLTFDPEGRIGMPPELRECAGITDRAAFVGKGALFQIWEPSALRQHMAEARSRAKAEGRSLSLRKPTVVTP